jgi:hypothetical protein
MEQGTPFVLQINWADPSGNPIDLTGYTGRMKVITDNFNQVPIITFATDDTASPNTTLTMDSSGLITASATNDATQALTFSSAQYALFVESPSPSSQVTKILEGNVQLKLGQDW